jgi:peptide chain release factor 2
MAENPSVWNDPMAAQGVMRERNKLSSQVESVRVLERELSDTIELIELAEMDGDDALLDEAQHSLEAAKAKAGRAELEALLSGEADGNDAYLEVNAGAGGTEAQDWANILRRMYVRWAQSHGMKVEEIDESPGEEAGIKSSTLLIKGENAYGWLKTESGVHRLVRISPFDSPALPVYGFTP